MNAPIVLFPSDSFCIFTMFRFLEQYEALDHSGTPFDPETYVPPVVHTPQSTHTSHQMRSSSSLSPHLANQLQMHSLGGRAQAKPLPLATAITGLPNLLQFTPAQFQQLQLLLKLQATQLEQQRHVVQTARYDWLVRSLQCGLPNEVDFAFNTLVILSHDDKRIMPLSTVSGVWLDNQTFLFDHFVSCCFYIGTVCQILSSCRQNCQWCLETEFFMVVSVSFAMLKPPGFYLCKQH